MSTVAMEEYDLMKDSKYRLYVAAVDKALKNFEYTSEWADLISALGKLNKVLLSYTKFPVIPRRIKISKRLAQCMHPALPSGVHLKALETYDIIFRCMGTNRLAHELFIYSAGLFPLMSHAAMKIRPTLLTIYETHFVPLAERLRPALSGFLSGILPGLDTGTDHFDRTNSLLENVCEGVEPPYFFTCIWQCVANNSPVRLPAISYVLAHYSKKLSMEDQLHLMGNDIGLMVSGLCAAVQDSSVLVQRAALDLLMVCFPMKNQQLLYSDMVRLVTAALTTILRRDMSLNRRLYSWLLGAESTNTPTPDDDDDLNTTPNHNHTVAYDLLNDALRLILKRCTSETPIDVKPYRLLTSLFDKPQIGPVILDSILYDVFRSLYLSCLHQQKQRSANGRCVSFNGDWSSLKHDEGVLSRQFVGRNCQELVKNANLLFDTLQGYYIWSYIEKLFGEAVEHATTYERREQRRVNEIGSGPPHILEICILTDFLLDIIPIEAYTESTSNILPSLFTKVVATLKTHLKELDHHEITESLQLCTKILNKLQPISLSQAETPSEALEEVEEKVLEKSKSDSRINENAEKNELSVEDAARERSYSNQMQKKKEKSSPRIEKKAKNKKSKSSPKLSESPSSPEQKEEPVVEAPPRATKIENKYCIECLEEYKSFFVQFVRAKLIPNTDIQTRFRSLIADKNERTESLRRMLSARILEHPKSEFNPVKLPRISSPLPPPNDPSFSENKPTSSTKSMTVASNVLLEFSAFPNLLGGEAEAELPAWARALVVVACCEEATRDVQLAAMNTLLEVFDRPGILDVAHVRYLEEHTVVVEAMARILWRLLGSSDDQHQLMLCVALLYRIHDTFDGQQFVENVIGGYLTRETASVHDVKRFFLLWHLGRDIDPKVRDFDRSLLKILDNLRCEDRPELQLLAESFLAHSLLHNDIHRILNPVLTKLLASDTARVCIKHVNIQWQSDATLEDDETTETAAAKKVYAISSVNGKIMYHVTEEPGAKPAKKKWFAFAKTGKKYATGDVVAKRTTVGNASPKGPKTVKLIVNPLGSKEVYPVGLEGCYSKRESHSSLESLSDSETLPFREQLGGGDRDSGFDSLKHRSQTELSSNGKESIAKSLLESMEPISDGIKADAAGARLPKSHSFDEKFVVAKTADAESSLVQSWSYCVSDSANLHASHELELSRSAEDFFIAQDEQRDIIDDILNAIVDKACVPRRPADLDVKPKVNAQQPKNIVLYPIHAHLCLYCEVFDSNQVVYALRTLKSCIAADPHLFIKCLATSGLKNLRNNDVLYQLARHRKSSLGFGFSGAVGGEHVNHYRGYMFLDVVVTVCLNYCRSFYPFLEESPLAAEEMSNNLKIQLQSLDVLDVIVKTLIAMVRDNTKGFSSYIADLLVKCKVQKILLNCLLTSVRNFDEDITFAEEILAYNNFQLCDASNRVGEHVEAFQVQILRLINSLIVLEHDVFGARTDGAPAARIPQQQIFLSAILSALRHHSMRHIHEQWLRMVTACLPYFGDNLKQIAISVVHQICNNVEDVAASYARAELRDELCSDYAVTQLEALTVLCHYCLLDSSQTVNQNVPASAALPNPGEIINNLFNAFFTPMNVDATLSLKQNSDNYRNARKTILGHMPRIISSVGKLWQTVVEVEEEYSGVYGSGKVVKQQLLEFLSPIAVHHGASFVAAVAVAWYERRNPFSSVKTVLPEPNAGQNNLVYLISAIRVIPLDNLVQTVTAVIKNPPPTEGLNADICLEVAVLELFYCYMRNASSSQFSEAWGSLLALVREGCALSPPSQFLLAALLHEIMIKCCPLEERKDQKDLQDVTTKLIDCVSQVCGSCLEQTTWLRRNFAVKEQEEDSAAESNIISGSNSEIFVNSSYSVQAQLVLSEILAPILDICFGSSEKDKVNAILTSLMFNIVPYLKTHTARNMPSFSACSKLLSALSSYQYTRKAWKKDVFDLLLDNAFFQMDFSCLKFWRVIVDNLMTHDNTTFRDLMNRVSMNQSGSLSIFSSREQEYEQKAQLLKRLAYVIFCSEMDQYAKYMPDIQEQLTSSLRLSVPGVQAQVFLCFRVILLRMSPLHVTSLWPIIISEMLQVFLQIEQELSTDTEEFRTNNSSHIKLMSSLDASWATNSNNGLHALGNPHWLRLQLATVKLLDLALLLPATTLPQFQMYRWAFVGDDLHRVDPRHSFLPHVVRIADLMDRKYADAPTDVLPMKRNEPLLTTNAVARLRDLHGFFRTLSRCSDRHRSECGRLAPDNDACSERRPDRKTDAILERIDKVVEMDFLDKIAR